MRASGVAATLGGPARAAATPLARIDRVPTTAYIATMALRDILILPDKRLRQGSEPVKKIDAGSRKLIEERFETKDEAPGIRVAGIHGGAPKRIITIELAQEERPEDPQGII